MATGNGIRGKLGVAACSEHFRRTTQQVLAQMSRQDAECVDTKLLDEMLAEGEDCVIRSTWRLEHGKNAHPIVVRITDKAMYRFRSGEQAQRADMNENFVCNLQTVLRNEHYDVDDASPRAFRILVDELFFLESR